MDVEDAVITEPVRGIAVSCVQRVPVSPPDTGVSALQQVRHGLAELPAAAHVTALVDVGEVSREAELKDGDVLHIRPALVLQAEGAAGEGVEHPEVALAHSGGELGTVTSSQNVAAAHVLAMTQ